MDIDSGIMAIESCHVYQTCLSTWSQHLYTRAHRHVHRQMHTHVHRRGHSHMNTHVLRHLHNMCIDMRIDPVHKYVYGHVRRHVHSCIYSNVSYLGNKAAILVNHKVVTKGSQLLFCGGEIVRWWWWWWWWR